MRRARPDHDRDAAADDRSALSTALAQIRLSGAIFLHSEYTEAWAYESMASQDVAAVLAPDAARLLIFHVVVSGSCWIEAGSDMAGAGHVASSCAASWPATIDCSTHAWASFRPSSS